MGAGYSWTRQRLTESTFIPPAFAGDLAIGKQGLPRRQLRAGPVGQEPRGAALGRVEGARQPGRSRAGAADAVEHHRPQRTTNWGGLYALLDIARGRRGPAQPKCCAWRGAGGGWGSIPKSSSVPPRPISAAAQVTVSALEGNIQRTRYQLGALLGKGPDRGLAIARPTLGVGDEIHLPANLPADLVSPPPGYRGRALACGGHHARHQGGQGRVLSGYQPERGASASMPSAGAAACARRAARYRPGRPIHLPIFDGGALRAQLKGRYAEFDFAVANYNDTLIHGADRCGHATWPHIRAVDAQLVNATRSDEAAHARAPAGDGTQYQGGLDHAVDRAQRPDHGAGQQRRWSTNLKHATPRSARSRWRPRLAAATPRHPAERSPRADRPTATAAAR